jgi:hypothetical protein
MRVLGVRAEARDFIIAIRFLGSFTSGLQHILAGGGVVVKF